MPSTRNCMKGREGVFDNLIADGGGEGHTDQALH